MPTLYDTYMQSQQQQGQQGAESPFGAFVSQKSPYQSIAQSAMASASAKRGAELQQNRHQSYRDYLDSVISGTIGSGEADARAPFIPSQQSNPGYRGANYVDPSVGYARGAIPAAYEFAEMSQTPFEFGVDRLQWGGPTSTKTTARDFLDTSRINQQRSAAEETLRRAIVPEYLRQDVSQGLADKWEDQWTPEFNRLKSERAEAQSNWWKTADWANKSVIPGYVETVTPGTRTMIAPESYLYHDATRELVNPEYQREVSAPRQVYRDPVRELVTPESQRLVREAQRVWNAERQELVTPAERKLVSGASSIPESWSRNQAAWNAYLQQLDATVIYPGQDRHFYYPTYEAADNMTGTNTPNRPQGWYDGYAWTVQDQFEEGLYDRGLQSLNQYFLNTDPRTLYENQDSRVYGTQFLSGRDYGTDWGAHASRDLWMAAGLPESEYASYRGDDGSLLFNPPQIDYQYNIPQNMITYTPASSTAAVYEDIPAVYNTIPGYWEDQSALYETIPAVYRETSPGGYETLPGVYETVPAEYRDIPAYTETIAALYNETPPVTRAVPSRQRAGFKTTIDPITGVAIPDWWDKGTTDLASAYGMPAWYMQ